MINHRLGTKSLWYLAVLSLIVSGCSGKKGETGSRPAAASGTGGRARLAFPVEVSLVRNQIVTYSLDAVGSVEAFEKVQITTRVAGVVERVLFSEGTRVQAGQVLVEIEPERFRLAVESAQASYEKALAARADAESALKRREAVIAKTPGLIPGEEIETWRTKVSLGNADAAQAEALLNQAKLNLRDAIVRAPTSGLIETRTVQTGQYVQVGTTLTTLVRRDPLLVRFQIPESQASRVKSGMKILFRVGSSRDEYEAKLIHVATAADESNRMVAITAEVSDKRQDQLRPGSFAQVRLPISDGHPAPMIPQTAIRPSELGFLAYVVENGKAQERIIRLGMRTLDGMVEVTDGLKAGEQLVIRGAEALKTGYTVVVSRTGEKTTTVAKPVGQ